MTLGFIHKTIKNSFNPLRKIIWLLKFCPISALHSVVIWGLERSKIRADRYLCLCTHPSPPLAVLYLFHLHSSVKSLSSHRLSGTSSLKAPSLYTQPLTFPFASQQHNCHPVLDAPLRIAQLHLQLFHSVVVPGSHICIIPSLDYAFFETGFNPPWLVCVGP